MSGTDKINAANELRNFGRKFAAVIAIADELERLGSIENGIAEAESRLGAVRLEIETARTEADRLKAENAATLQRAAEEAARTIESAHATRDRANAEKERIVAEARTEAQGIVAKAEAAKRAVEQEISVLNRTREIAKAETESAVKERDAINAELEQIAQRAGGRRKAG